MYSTELMEQILTSEIGQQIIQRVTNKYGNSYVGLWLFQIIGMSNDEVKAMVEDFKNKRCHKQRHGLYHYGSSQWACLLMKVRA